MRRLRHSDGIFFVTTNLRRTIPPLTASEFPFLISAFQQSRRRLGFALCGYVLMPDHWHALIWPQHPVTISDVVHEIKRLSARSLNASRGTKGPVWQHQFWDRFVRNAKEFGERLDYLHHNPVEMGLASRPQDWAWSSHNNFALERPCVAACPIQIDYVRPVW